MAAGGLDAGPGADAPGPARVNGNPFERGDPPLLALTLWPHRSMNRTGLTWFMGLMTAGLAVPLLPLTGTPAAWGLLPFLVAMLLGLYLALRRSYADGRLVEELRLWPDLITVVRWEPRGVVRQWHANPFWVRLRLFENARIEKYLTLEGNGREIELGSFLSPDERVDLHAELAAALASVSARS
jgi:uncharacterized membrane protein